MTQQPLPEPRTSSRTRLARRTFLFSIGALVGMIVLGAVLTVEEWLVLVPSFQRAMQDMFSRGALLTTGLVIALIAFGLLFQRATRQRTSALAGPEASHTASSRLLAAALGVFVLGIAGAGYLLIDDLRIAFRDERYSQQAGIARLKAQQIDQWVHDKAIDLGLLVTALKGLPLGQIEQVPEVRQIAELLFAQVLIGHPERLEVMLYSPEGRLLVEAGGLPGRDDANELEGAVRQAAQDRKLQVGQVRMNVGTPPRTSMAFLQPFTFGPPPATSHFVVALVVDPAHDLFKNIQTWPTDSATSEVVLARRDGNDIVYLVPPRFRGREISPEGLRLPLSTPESTAGAAILQGDGTREGVDYRRVPVVSASHSATIVPWFVIAKTDYEEVMRPIDRRSTKIILLFGATTLLAAVLVWALWSSQREAYLALRVRPLKAKDLALRNLGIVDAVQDTLIFFDSDNRIVETNEAAQRVLGYSAEELRGMEAQDLRAPEDMHSTELKKALALSTSHYEFRTIIRRKDGSTFPAEVRVITFELDGQSYRQAMAIDISDRVKLEQEVLRLARVKRSLQAATGILLGARTEAEVFEQICQSLVEVGNYRLVYIAIPNDDAGKTFRLPAIAGYDAGYLTHAHFTWNDESTGNGPLGMAIKTDSVQVNQDFENNPSVKLWREEARANGYRSSIVFPLRRHGKGAAALSIYAAVPHAFETEEVKLLSALAHDISQALSAIGSASGGSARLRN